MPVDVGEDAALLPYIQERGSSSVIIHARRGRGTSVSWRTAMARRFLEPALGRVLLVEFAIGFPAPVGIGAGDWLAWCRAS